MSNYTFASMPSVSIARSKFTRTQPHNVSFNLGEIVVLGFDECIPGSTHKIELGSLVRMSTPIAPIMDDIQFDVFAVLCPLRLTWSHWKEFMGESDQAGIATTTYTIPKFVQCTGSAINSLADDLGIPPVNYGTGADISLLPFRALKLIYNRWFRNQNVEAPIPVNLGDTYSAAGDADYLGLTTSGGTVGSQGRFIAYKLPDYFTSALPYAQKGDPVRILTDDLPVVSKTVTHSMSTGMSWVDQNGSSLNSVVLGTNNFGIGTNAGSNTGATVEARVNNLWAQCTNTINDLRFAFQLQKALEKDALYGSRYWEVLRAHYAVTSPDATLQDPELLGHIKFDINISQVLQTTGFTSPSSTNLGTPGANSVTANKAHVCTFSTCEHSYLFILGVARQKRHTYSQGINKLWTRSERWDFYHPVFANIGAQKVLEKELYSNSATPEAVFGYQEAWAEYRFLPGYNSGLMNPARTGSLDYWTLADNYGVMPTLGPTFLKEDRSNLTRALVTGATGPDFIGSFFIKDTVVNPMPLYSIPGFADHH